MVICKYIIAITVMVVLHMTIALFPIRCRREENTLIIVRTLRPQIINTRNTGMSLRRRPLYTYHRRIVFEGLCFSDSMCLVRSFPSKGLKSLKQAPPPSTLALICGPLSNQWQSRINLTRCVNGEPQNLPAPPALIPDQFHAVTV